MRIDLAGWESAGLRCPDIKVDLRRGQGVPSVTLIQMPNGTGKTTTLQLLNATLSGAAAKWSPEKVRTFRRQGDLAPAGVFKVTLLVDGKPLSIELTLDYDSGQVRFKSTNPGSGGQVPQWHVKPELHRFLAPEFLSLFIFDGEFADRLLDSESSEADRAVDALCQLYLLDQLSDFAGAHWDRTTKAQGAKTTSGLTRWQEAHTRLTARQKTVTEAKAKAKDEITKLHKEAGELTEKMNARLTSGDTTRERHEAAQLALATAEGEVKTGTAALMTSMRLPHALHPALAASLVALRDNLDRLKLPENTSAQFFEELIREDECICGRPMDAHSIEEIKTRAKRYLDADDAGVINAMKSDIEQFAGVIDEDAGFNRVARLSRELTRAVRNVKDAEGQVRALKAQLIAQGDEQLAEWQSRLEKCETSQRTYEDLLKSIEGPGEASEADDKTMSLSQIAKRLVEARDKIAEITKTVTLRRQTDLLQALLKKATAQARHQIKAELLAECNTRLAKILANDPLVIEKIEKSIRLKDQDGASVGQTLSVGYTFLMTVLKRGANDFPLIVDSPANPIDQGVRRKIGKLIPELCTQFVGFTINTERVGFVDTLEANAPDIAFLTLFRKTPGAQRLMKDLPAGRFTETANAVLVVDRDYFYRFDIKDEEDA
jgi:DNA sulfur modification protein DndD